MTKPNESNNGVYQMKRSYIFIFSFIVIMTGSINMNAQTSEPKTVNKVDLKKYLGTWYEIAKIPNSFQDDCVKNTTATYKLNDDGTISVSNKCVEEDGEINDATGTAKVVDKKTNAKLEVSFVSLLGINLFWGDYWIIGLSDDYSYAVIGHPKRKYGWILSRTPKMSEEDLKEAHEILRSKGYNPNDFEMTLQEKR